VYSVSTPLLKNVLSLYTSANRCTQLVCTPLPKVYPVGTPLPKNTVYPVGNLVPLYPKVYPVNIIGIWTTDSSVINLASIAYVLPLIINNLLTTHHPTGLTFCAIGLSNSIDDYYRALLSYEENAIVLNSTGSDFEEFRAKFNGERSYNNY